VPVVPSSSASGRRAGPLLVALAGTAGILVGAAAWPPSSCNRQIDAPETHLPSARAVSQLPCALRLAFVFEFAVRWAADRDARFPQKSIV
jgi:hypothetical protein